MAPKSSSTSKTEQAHSRQWFILYNDSIRGPFTSGQLRLLAQRAQLTSDVQVRLGENGKWYPVMSIRGLFNDNLGQNVSDKASINKVTGDGINSSTGFLELSSDDLNQPVPEICSLEESPIVGSVPQMIDLPNSTTPPSSVIPPGTHGEIRSEAPPLPGKEAVSAPITQNISTGKTFGEMRSEAPPLPGNEGAIPPVVPPPPSSLGSVFSFVRLKKNPGKTTGDSIPKLIKTLIASDEKILYVTHPALIVLILQGVINSVIYLIFGLIPAIMVYVYTNPQMGIIYGIVTTVLLAISIVINYIRWLHACYVITNTRTFVKSGILSVDVGYIFNSNIQMLKVRTSLIDWLLGLNTIELRTAAGLLALQWTPLATVLPFYGRQ